MEGLFNFLSPEAGQRRTKWLNDAINDNLSYFLGPTGIDSRLSGVAEMNPINDIYRAGGDMRDGDYVGAAVNTATAAAPLAATPFLKGGGRAAAETLEDVLTGVSVGARGAGDATKRFALSEDGAVGFTRTGDNVMSDVSIKNEGSGLYSVFSDGQKAGEIRIAGNGSKDFVERSQLEPNFQGKRIGHQAYNLVERDIGRRLVPSPTGLSANGSGFWRRRIKDYEPEEAVDAYRRSQAAGREYGIPDRDINMRLYGVGGAEALDAISPQLTPAQQQAQDILDMLKRGRANEVTDDMMAAADDLYLFDNYDLPMDEASRMARAAEMGFTTGRDRQDVMRELRGLDNPQLVHYTNQDFSAFRIPERQNRQAIWATPDPSVNLATKDNFQDFSDEGVVGIPVMGRMTKRVSPYEFRMAGDPMTPGFPRNVTLEDVEKAKSVGADYAEAGLEYAIFDPRNIRSRFARFDPRLAHLRNLSAGVGGISAYNAMTAEEKNKEKVRKYLKGGT